LTIVDEEDGVDEFLGFIRKNFLLYISQSPPGTKRADNISNISNDAKQLNNHQNVSNHPFEAISIFV